MDFINSVLKEAAAKGQNALNEAACYAIFNNLGLKTPFYKLLNPGDNLQEALKDFKGDKIVLKIVSDTILHKTEAGGVKITDKVNLPQAYAEMRAKFKNIQTFMLVEYIEYPPLCLGREILLGVRFDKAFGPVISLGFGGTAAEETAASFKNSTSITSVYDDNFEAFIKNSAVWKYAGGLVRGTKEQIKLDTLLNWVKSLAKTAVFYNGQNAPFIIEELEINPLAIVNGEAIALDGVLRFTESKTAILQQEPSAKGIEALLEPKTVAVAGVSESKVNMGRIILNNIVEAGFNKDNLYIIKPNSTEIDGIKCFASCNEVPQNIDMYVVTVPAASALSAVKDAALSGKVNGLVLITGGIGEKEGTQEAKEQLEKIIAEGKKINPAFTLNGSNSLGIISNPSKVNTLFIPKNKLTPPLGINENLARCAFISQSGAFVISALSKMPEVKPKYSVMVGNQLDITVADFALYLAESDKVDVILLYCEGLKQGDGIKLIKAAEAARKTGKKIVLYAAGRTPTGQKAVMGHTASIAGDYAVIKQLASKKGILAADTFAEFELLAKTALSCALNPPKNDKVFMISNAGFETSGMADHIPPKSPVKALLPDENLSNKLKEILKKYKLDGIVDIRNPFDLTPMCPDEAVEEVILAIAKSGLYGSLVFATIPLSPAVKTLEEENPQIMFKLAKISKEYQMPVLISVSAGRDFDYYRKTAAQAGLAVFTEADSVIKTLAKYLESLGFDKN